MSTAIKPMHTCKNMRQLLVDKTTRLILVKGLDNVKSRDITEAMNISRSHLYHYFSNMKELQAESRRHFLEEETRHFRCLMAGMSYDEKLAAFVDYYLPSHKDDSWNLYGDVWHKAVRDSDYAQLASHIHHLWSALLSEIFSEMHPPALVSRMARTVMAALNGYASTMMLGEYASSAQDAMDDILVLISGLSRPGPTALR
ncbi:TetR/AcrR family transcriptional regulator [Enterobacter asburiae]|uniref:TetR/AcrR family transcriptional regulator n=1 Tax=Enterobacter asburiae TaxID=61645 RepID=UPI00264896FB|nr:TetR/AcrR family transcriptional regulator [Enterobacter asburiae]WKE09639.1 TetR/AcrR family transcriptional regulator [Enterobacter asburiae]